ncbi:LYR motif-containing protein 4 isoform X2 [Emys orbicularis]|uniref:LYR motif-containing protein 4 isoform X2 n=1 Tax=Emys orbicularis TaxID=82168 RepID=UPI0031FDD471
MEPPLGWRVAAGQRRVCNCGRGKFCLTSGTYTIRRIRDAFRENKHLKDSEEIQTLVNKARTNLEIIHRQVTIGQLYSTQKLVIESPENTEII